MEEVVRARLRWFRHVMRMEEDRQAKKFMEWIPRGRQPRGRPRKRWKQGVGESLKRRGGAMDEVVENNDYEDREGWRRFVRISSG